MTDYWVISNDSGASESEKSWFFAPLQQGDKRDSGLDQCCKDHSAALSILLEAHSRQS